MQVQFNSMPKKKITNCTNYLRSALNHRVGEGLGGLLIVVVEGSGFFWKSSHRPPLMNRRTAQAASTMAEFDTDVRNYAIIRNARCSESTSVCVRQRSLPAPIVNASDVFVANYQPVTEQQHVSVSRVASSGHDASSQNQQVFVFN